MGMCPWTAPDYTEDLHHCDDLSEALVPRARLALGPSGRDPGTAVASSEEPGLDRIQHGPLSGRDECGANLLCLAAPSHTMTMTKSNAFSKERR